MRHCFYKNYYKALRFPIFPTLQIFHFAGSNLSSSGDELWKSLGHIKSYLVVRKAGAD